MTRRLNRRRVNRVMKEITLTHHANPSFRDLEAWTGIHRSSVWRYVYRLETEGKIRVLDRTRLKVIPVEPSN